MKNKFIITIITSISLLLIGCTSQTSIKATNSEAMPDYTKENMRYYYNVFENINNFYESFKSVGNSIDTNDENLTSLYMDNIKYYSVKLKEIKVPYTFKQSHTYLIDAIDQYNNGLIKLIKSYNISNYDDYKSADKELMNASDNINVYMNEIKDSTSEFSSFLDYITQINYYFKIITIYDYNNKFTEEENKVLFTLERSICNYTHINELIIKNTLNGSNNKNNIKQLNNIINDLTLLNCKNKDLNIYKENTIKNLKSYTQFILSFENKNNKDIITKDYLLSLNTELQTFSYLVYDNLENLSNFYSSYNIDLGFKNTKEQLLNK